MKLAVFAYTRAGCRTAGRVCRALPEAERCCYAPPRLEAPGFAALDAGVYGEAFANMDALIFVGACGVAVRSIAPFVRDKKTDPAVLCLDERASFTSAARTRWPRVWPAPSARKPSSPPRRT